MKKLTFCIFISVISLIIVGQENSEDEYVYMKCGTKLGRKSEIIEGCVGGIQKEYKEAYKEQSKICECIIMTIAKHYTYTEFEALVELHGADFINVIIGDRNLAVLSELQDCTLEYLDEDFDITIGDEDFEEAFMIGCVRQLKDDPDLQELGINEYLYCNCIKDKFLERGFSLSDLDELADENSVLFNEIILSCLNNPGVIEEEFVESSPNDVVGSSKYDYINLLNLGVAYKVKITIGNLNKYFTLDSGASDVIISTEFERELLLEGLIGKENYIRDDYYELADGSIVKCRRLIINNVGIGKFKVNNVIMAVISSESTLLLGKSFLDKFDNWSIENENSTLYLERKY